MCTGGYGGGYLSVFTEGKILLFFLFALVFIWYSFLRSAVQDSALYRVGTTLIVHRVCLYCVLIHSLYALSSTSPFKAQRFHPHTSRHRTFGAALTCLNLLSVPEQIPVCVHHSY